MLMSGWSPSEGLNGETALLLAVLGIVLVLTGAGTWSLDGVLASRRRGPLTAGDPRPGRQERDRSGHLDGALHALCAVTVDVAVEDIRAALQARRQGHRPARRAPPSSGRGFLTRH